MQRRRTKRLRHDFCTIIARVHYYYYYHYYCYVYVCVCECARARACVRGSFEAALNARQQTQQEQSETTRELRAVAWRGVAGQGMAWWSTPGRMNVGPLGFVSCPSKRRMTE